MQKRHLNRSVYLEGTSIVQSQISASGCEPLLVPSLGKSLKQAIRLRSSRKSDVRGLRRGQNNDWKEIEHFPYLQKANVMQHSYSLCLQKINVVPYLHFTYLHSENMIPHFHFHILHSDNVVSHFRFAGLKCHAKADKATFHLDASTIINTPL